MRTDRYGYVLLGANNIKSYGATEVGTPAANFAFMQAAIDSSHRQVTFGKQGEVYVISQPLMLKSDCTYVFDCEIKIKDGVETLLTGNTIVGATVFPVASVVGFALGEYVGIWDSAAAMGYDQRRATVGKIIDITGLNITIDSISGDAYETTQAAKLGHVQNCVIAYRKENIKILGKGVINNNRDGQSYVHPTHTIGIVEYQLAGCGMTIYDCDYVEIDDTLLFKEAVQHNLAITGQGSGGYENTNITIKKLISQEAHEKNILCRYITGLVIEDIVVKDALFEDGIIFYSGVQNVTAKNIIATGNARGGFFWNSASNSNLVATGITTSGNGWGIYIQSKNAVISNVACGDACLIAAGYAVSNLEINNITFTNVNSIKGYVIRITGGVDGVTFNNAVINGCSVVGIKCDSLVGGVDPIDVVFNNGGIYNHTGAKTSIEAGTDIAFNNFEGLT